MIAMNSSRLIGNCGAPAPFWSRAKAGALGSSGAEPGGSSADAGGQRVAQMGTAPSVGGICAAGAAN